MANIARMFGLAPIIYVLSGQNVKIKITSKIIF
jgi:hypothetical protein